MVKNSLPRRNVVIRLISLFWLGVSVLVVVLYDRHVTYSKSPKSVLEVSPDAIELGTRLVDELVPIRFDVRNISADNIDLELTSSCSCMSLRPNHKLLAPNDVITVNANIEMPHSPGAAIRSIQLNYYAVTEPRNRKLLDVSIQAHVAESQ